MEEKLPDHANFFTTNEFSNLKKIKRANLATKLDLDSIEHRVAKNKEEIEKK